MNAINLTKVLHIVYQVNLVLNSPSQINLCFIWIRQMFVSKSIPYISIFEIVQLILTIKFEIQITVCKTNVDDIFFSHDLQTSVMELS